MTDTHFPKAFFVSFWPNPSVSLFMRWPPKPNSHLPKTFNEAKVEPYLHISSSKVEFFKVSGNRSGASSYFGLINHKWVFYLRICLAIEKILGPKGLYFGVCCILIHFGMNEIERKFVLVKNFFKGSEFWKREWLFSIVHDPVI